jgi:hypothetical protein
MFAHPTHRYLIAVMAGLTAAALLAAGPARAGDWDERYAEEAARIASYQDRVLRAGDDLHLQLLNGQEVLLTDPPDVELSARDPEGHGGIEIHLVRSQTGRRILGPLTHLPVTGAAG